MEGGRAGSAPDPLPRPGDGPGGGHGAGRPPGLQPAQDWPALPPDLARPHRRDIWWVLNGSLCRVVPLLESNGSPARLCWFYIIGLPRDNFPMPMSFVWINGAIFFGLFWATLGCFGTLGNI